MGGEDACRPHVRLRPSPDTPPPASRTPGGRCSRCGRQRPRQPSLRLREALARPRLIREKQTADAARQKTLRARMRRIGFYISDFAGDPAGFVVSDLDDLIARGV